MLYNRWLNLIFYMGKYEAYTNSLFYVVQELVISSSWFKNTISYKARRNNNGWIEKKLYSNQILYI
jgi:hypothetical protein